MDTLTPPIGRRAPAGVTFLDPAVPASIEAYLVARGLATSAELPARIERAGDGNMNLTLRVVLRDRRFILKQGRPWVEKYDHIAAPWERTLVEGAFYRAVSAVPRVAARMPALRYLDDRDRVIVLEDLGAAGDYTSLYADRTIAAADVEVLLEWLAALSRVPLPAQGLPNRAMRQLNHEHIFTLPLAAGNGLDLDAVMPGLTAAGRVLQADDAYREAVEALGAAYLADRATLVHGDFFPGSWVRTDSGVRIIDPEFCFAGAREFDYGVMLAHLALGGVAVAAGRSVVVAARAADLDERLLLGFAGVEIMRRLLGVAQLPLSSGLDARRRLLALSRKLVLAPDEAWSCWP